MGGRRDRIGMFSSKESSRVRTAWSRYPTLLASVAATRTSLSLYGGGPPVIQVIHTRFGQRAIWGVADQTFSSGTNFAVGIYVASQTSTLAFGAFTLAFVTYLLFLNVGQAVVSQPLLIRHSNQPAIEWAHATGRGVGVALALGIGVGLLCVAVGSLVGGDLGAAFLALGLGLPGLLLQDAWRSAFFAAGRDRDAVVNDAVWAAVLILIFGTLLAQGSKSVFDAVFGWGIAATVAALVGIVQAGVRPRLANPRSWFQEHADLIPRFVGETAARAGTIQLVYYLIGVITGIVGVGTIRAAELVVVGPFNIIYLGIGLITLPEAARRLSNSRVALLRFCRLLAIGMISCGVVWGVLALVSFEVVGKLILGESSQPAQTVLLPVVVALIGLVSGSGALVGLRVLGAANWILRVTLASSVATLAATTVGAWTSGAMGAAWGMAAGSWAGATGMWLALQFAPDKSPPPDNQPSAHSADQP